MIPDDFAMELQGDHKPRSSVVAMGLEWRLTKVAAEWSGRPNLKVHDEALLRRALAIKTTRDDIEHVRQRTIYTSDTAEDAIYVRLLRYRRLLSIAETVDQVIAHYGKKPN